jgi:hypothetical protein
MAEQPEVEWEPTCEQADCIGVRLPSASMCLAHVGEEEIAAALKRIGETGEIDARGVPITRVLLERILTAVPCGANKEPLILGCQFDRATFSGEAEFREATFSGDAVFAGVTFSDRAVFAGATFERRPRFDRAIFNGEAMFRAVFNDSIGLSEAIFNDDAAFGGATFSGDTGFAGVTFNGRAWFSGVTFNDGAWFGGVTFSGDTGFDGTIFNGGVGFDKATFSGNTRFDGATFERLARFGKVAFNGDAGFDGATFGGDAVFSGATFSGDTVFSGATFKRRAECDGARFEQARQFGPLLAWRGLVLDGAQFAQPVQIEVSSTEVCCRGARFPGGVQFRLRWARVVLDDTDLAAPSILAGIPRLSNEELARQEEQIARAYRLLMAGEISEWPQLVSMRRANVAGLGLSNVSAAGCRFAGAHNLDKLRLESDVSFATAPSPLGSGTPRWGGREVIAEERAWRAAPQRPDRSRRRWVAPGWPGWLGDKPDALDPGQIAGLYRALRKGREDIKDEPGAADFYYGEMEMRRHRPVSYRNPGDQSSATVQGRAERGILTAYWLMSGYGLRASRAILTAYWLMSGYGLRASRALAVTGQIAGLYRALRKGREDARPSDQSSATAQGRAERGILTAYWLVSGYGLRASRALATLLLILALATVGFVTVGFAPSTTTAYQQVTLPSGGTRYEPREIRGAPPGWAEAATYSVQSTTSLLRAPTTEPLTESGRVIEIMVRLLGPLLIGLALLALRGRVKR